MSTVPTSRIHACEICEREPGKSFRTDLPAPKWPTTKIATVTRPEGITQPKGNDPIFETFDLDGTWVCRPCIEDHTECLIAAGGTIPAWLDAALREFARREIWKAHHAYLTRFGLSGR